MPTVYRQEGSEFVVTVSRFFSELGPVGQNRYLYFQIALFSTLVLLAILSCFPMKQKSKQPRIQMVINSDWLFASFLFLFLVISRIPNAIYGYQNPDEGVWIACAKALICNPWPWSSVDTSTSGPLVLTPLLFLHAFSFPIDFGSIKIASALTLGVTVIFTFLSYTNLVAKPLARIAIIPLAIALALTSYWDFITYNGEQVPLLILSVSLFILSKIYTDSKVKLKQLVLLGFLLGLVPFAKLQAVPMALWLAFFVLGLLIQIRVSWRRIVIYAVSGIVPSILILFWVWVGGGLEHFWNSYILYNFSYADGPTTATAEIPLLGQFSLAWNMLFDANDMTPFFQYSVAICFLGILFIRNTNRKSFKIVVFSIVYFLISLYCIGKPYRTFTHYTLFAVFSINLVTVVLLNNLLNHNYLKLRNEKFAKASFFSLLFISILLFVNKFNFKPGYNILADRYKSHYSTMPEVISAINNFSKRGDKIAIWGWSNTFYSDMDLIMGTRISDPVGIFTQGIFYKYFLEVFMKDLEKNTPRIFLDAISPKALVYHDKNLYGFDKFPELKSYIDTNYREQASIDGYVVYVRR